MANSEATAVSALSGYSVLECLRRATADSWLLRRYSKLWLSMRGVTNAFQS